MVGVAAGILFLSGIYWYWSSHAQLDLEIASAVKTEKEKNFTLQQSVKVIKQREDVDKFLSGAVNWLDEIKHIATKMPPSEDIMLLAPSLDLVTDRTSTTGQITVTAVAKDASALKNFRESISDKEHEVNGLGPKELQQRMGDYTFTEKETLKVFKTAWDPSLRNPSQRPLRTHQPMLKNRKQVRLLLAAKPRTNPTIKHPVPSRMERSPTRKRTP